MLCSLWALSANSQNFNAYFIGGFNVSQIEGDKLSGYNKAGFVIGGATNFKLNDQWHLQQEIVYYQRGSRATDAEFDLDNFTVRRIDYIDFLLLPNYRFNQQWSIIGGLGYGVFVNVKSDIDEDKSQFKGDLFATLGPQYTLGERWTANIRLQFSMLPILDNQDAFNNSISFTLRYKINQ